MADEENLYDEFGNYIGPELSSSSSSSFSDDDDDESSEGMTMTDEDEDEYDNEDNEDDEPIIQYDDEDEEDEDGSPEDYYEDGGTCGGFGQDFPERTSIDFGEDGRVESSPGKGPSYGDGDMGSPRLPDRCGNPITNNQMFTVDNSQPSSYTARFVPVGGRGLQNECGGAELGLLSLSPPRLYYNQSSAAGAAGAAQATIPF